MGRVKKAERKFGYEYPDPTPVEVPIELKRPETTDERLRRIVRELISTKAVDNGLESFEESNDFEVDDSFDGDGLMSPYEVQEMVPEFPDNLKTPDGSPVFQEKTDGEEMPAAAGVSDPSRKDGQDDREDSEDDSTSGD